MPLFRGEGDSAQDLLVHLLLADELRVRLCFVCVGVADVDVRKRIFDVVMQGKGDQDATLDSVCFHPQLARYRNQMLTLLGLLLVLLKMVLSVLQWSVKQRQEVLIFSIF